MKRPDTRNYGKKGFAPWKGYDEGGEVEETADEPIEAGSRSRMPDSGDSEVFDDSQIQSERPVRAPSQGDIGIEAKPSEEDSADKNTLTPKDYKRGMRRKLSRA